MFSRKKSVVGLDIGTNEIKAVELTDSGERVQVTGFGWGRIPSPEQVSETIRTVLHEAGISGKRVVTSVSGRSVIVRYITMPDMTNEELSSALRFEADKYIPFEVDEVDIDGQSLSEVDSTGDEESEMKVLMVAAKKDLIQEHVSQVQDLGLTPVVVDVDCFALGNAYELRQVNSSRLEEEESVVALVDVGATKTNIHVLRGTTSCFSREIYVGGNDFTESLSRHQHMDDYEAEELKRSPDGHEAVVTEAIQPVLEDLASEILLSFDYFENQFDQQVAEVFISGGASRTLGLKETFERVFGREVRSWDPLENISVKADCVDVEAIREHACQLPIAVGLSARLLDSA